MTTERKEWIRSQPDYSIKDPKIIREIANQSIEENDSSFISKIDPEFEVVGLYPTEMIKLNIKPDSHD